MGAILNKSTKPGLLFAWLSDEEYVGKWFTSIDLAVYIQTTCISTVISSVRRQLSALDYRMERKIETYNGKVYNFYRLIKVQHDEPGSNQETPQANEVVANSLC
jgi:hypothetical protein